MASALQSQPCASGTMTASQRRAPSHYFALTGLQLRDRPTRVRGYGVCLLDHMAATLLGRVLNEDSPIENGSIKIYRTPVRILEFGEYFLFELGKGVKTKAVI